MIKRIKDTIKQLVERLISPVFIVLLLVSFALWFIMRLSQEYTTSITVDVQLVTDFDANVWAQSEPIPVKLVAKGVGRDLIMYKVGYGQPVSVAVSALTLDKENEYVYRISTRSLERAINAKERNFSVVAITDTIPTIEISEIAEKRVAVVPNIEVNCEKQYIMDGDIKLAFDSVTLRGAKVLLDEVESVYTAHDNYNDVRSSFSGLAPLNIPSGLIANVDAVSFSVAVVGYTEYTVSLDVKSSDIGNIMIVPSTVTLKAKVSLGVPYSNESDAIEAYVDTDGEDLSGTVRRVKLRFMPDDVMDYTIEPEFVKLYHVE